MLLSELQPKGTSSSHTNSLFTIYVIVSMGRCILSSKQMT
jgi:quercetin dioxygenase-like cupin family protein